MPETNVDFGNPGLCATMLGGKTWPSQDIAGETDFQPSPTGENLFWILATGKDWVLLSSLMDG